jgi:nitric oxide reductase large subunit
MEKGGKTLGIRFIKIASVYFVIGIGMGMFMSITHRFQYAPTHAHINLLGWVSLAIIGFIYHIFPKAADNKLAKANFWLYNIGLPVMMIGLVLLESGYESVEPVIATGASVTSLGVLCFFINVLTNLKSSTPNKSIDNQKSA